MRIAAVAFSTNSTGLDATTIDDNEEDVEDKAVQLDATATDDDEVVVVGETANNAGNHFHNKPHNIGGSVFCLPSTHAPVTKSANTRKEMLAVLGRKLKAKLALKRNGRAKKLQTSPLGRRFYGAALQEAPCLSGYAAEQAIPCIVAGFLSDAGIDFDPAALASACPSEKTLREMVINGSVDTALWLKEQFLEASAIFFL